jgi:hypothetical protein
MHYSDLFKNRINFLSKLYQKYCEQTVSTILTIQHNEYLYYNVLRYVA